MGCEKEVIESREWVLISYAGKGIPTSDHLKLRTVKLTLADDSFPDGHVAVQILLLSVDPYIRTMMTGLPDGLSLPQIELNQVVKAFGIGRVIMSKNDDFTVGDIVSCPFFLIAEYCVTPPDFLRKIDTRAGASLPEYLSALGVPGFAAWVAIELIGDPKPGESIFISAAAGGVGMFAGQLAKIKGCRVVGSAGSDEKVKLLMEEFAYDDAFNYKKETDFDAALSKYFPNGIDVYLDNVGGKMLEAVLNHVNKRARIPLCGMISQYNQVWNEREGVRNLLNMVGKEVRMEGFMLGTFINRFGDFSKEMESYIKQGKINTKHHIYHGIESFLESLVSVFSSSNVGKVIIQVNNELEA